MIKRLGLVLPLVAIVARACSSGGGATPAASAGGTEQRGVRRGVRAARPSAASEAASAGAAGGGELVIWADDKRAAAIKPLAAAVGHGQRRQGRGPGHHREPDDAVQDRQPGRARARTSSSGRMTPSADFVQNSAIDPVTMPDTSMFDPLAVKGMTYQGQLYGVPVLDREHRADPEHGPRARLPGDDGRPRRDRPAAGQGQEGHEHHGAPGRPEGRRLPHLPAVHVGGRLVLRHHRDWRPGRDQRHRRLRRIDRGRPEAVRPGREGRRRAQALRRRQERHPAVHRRQDRRSSSPARGPSPTSRRPGSTTTSAPIPAFADGKPASPFIGVNGFYLASKGKNKTLAQEFLTSVVPTADFQSGLYAVDPRRPALTESATAAAADGPEHPEVRGRRSQRHDPARDPGDGPGLEPVRHRRGRDRRRHRPARRPSRPPPRRSATGSPTSSRRSARCGRAIREGRSAASAGAPDDGIHGACPRRAG